MSKIGIYILFMIFALSINVYGVDLKNIEVKKFGNDEVKAEKREEPLIVNDSFSDNEEIENNMENNKEEVKKQENTSVKNIVKTDKNKVKINRETNIKSEQKSENTKEVEKSEVETKIEKNSITEIENEFKEEIKEELSKDITKYIYSIDNFVDIDESKKLQKYCEELYNIYKIRFYTIFIKENDKEYNVEESIKRYLATNGQRFIAIKRSENRVSFYLSNDLKDKNDFIKKLNLYFVKSKATNYMDEMEGFFKKVEENKVALDEALRQNDVAFNTIKNYKSGIVSIIFFVVLIFTGFGIILMGLKYFRKRRFRM